MDELVKYRLESAKERLKSSSAEEQYNNAQEMIEAIERYLSSK